MGSYLYETHLHTYPVSKCAKADVKESLEFYKSLGYAGVFITNHFIDGNINISRSLPYEEKIEFYFTDYEKALEIGNQRQQNILQELYSSKNFEPAQKEQVVKSIYEDLKIKELAERLKKQNQ